MSMFAMLVGGGLLGWIARQALEPDRLKKTRVLRARWIAGLRPSQAHSEGNRCACRARRA